MTESTPNFPLMRFDNKEIDKKKPWGDDVLERKKFADVLTGRIKSGVSPYTISVSGGWGTGKTFMLQRWRQQLENDGYKAIYYNAWEDDFCVNPLVSIIGQIATEIKNPIFKNLITKVKKDAVPLLIEKSLNRINLTKKELQSEIKNALNKYSKQTAQIKALKESLETLTTKIEGETGHPLIFIIDELDRCRPTFAIEVLERIKHLFNIPGIIFVLGMNRTELEKSIKHVYGDINSEEYLRRFYDIDLTLSAPKSLDYGRYLVNTNKNALKILAQEKNHDSYIQSAEDIYPYLVNYLDLSLRDTEHCFRILCFMLSAKNTHDRGEGWSAIYLIVLRIKNPDLYWSFVQEKSSCEDVINYICGFIPDIDHHTTMIVNNVAKGIYALINDVEWKDFSKAASHYQKVFSIDSPKLEKLDKRVLPQIRKEGANYFTPYGYGSLRNMATLLDLVDY